MRHEGYSRKTANVLCWFELRTLTARSEALVAVVIRSLRPLLKWNILLGGVKKLPASIAPNIAYPR
jgi:hypothetical protein